MVVGTLALGQTLIILTAGIDLSNGAIMALGTIVMASYAVDGPTPLSRSLLGSVVCAAFGAVNGLLVTRVRLPPFIVTLGHAQRGLRRLTHIYSPDPDGATPVPRPAHLAGRQLPDRRHHASPTASLLTVLFPALRVRR